MLMSKYYYYITAGRAEFPLKHLPKMDTRVCCCYIFIILLVMEYIKLETDGICIYI